MAQVVDWFPGAQNRPMTIKSLFPKVERIRSYGASYKIKWLDSNRPQPTIGRDHSQKPTRWLIDGKEHRPTTKQLQMIGSYPLAFQFVGGENNAWNRIGNSVPPLFMFAIASKIRRLFLDGTKQEMSTSQDYLKTLEQAWMQHLAPRERDAPTLVSTFAGCGGSSLGYSMAGFQELLAVEWNDNAVETFKLNFPGVPVYHGDIAKLTVDECLRLTGLQPGELDLLDGSPPCQGFSTAGKRNMNDDRNKLYMEFVRLLRGLQPKIFVMENVSGLVKGKMKLVFAEIMRELKASGYQVRCKLLNAMYFNVPQSRQRLIFIGVRDDLRMGSSFPGAQGKVVTVKEAWVGLSENKQDATVAHCWIPVKPKSKTAMSLKRTPQGGRVGSFGGSRRLNYNKPSGTISTGGLLPGYPGSSWPSHPIQQRGISAREAVRLASFPDGFLFNNDWRVEAKRIGNSVPPLFMCAIASHIRTEILANV